MRFLRCIPAWLALAIVAVALVLPVGAMVVRSFHAYAVVTKDGTVYRATGEVTRGDDGVSFKFQGEGSARKVPAHVAWEDVAEVRSRFSLDHYASVFTDARTGGLLANSLWIGLGGALAALLLGLPVAWILARTSLPGWRLLGAFSLGPAVLPPFFIALGGARATQAFLMSTLGVEGATLQILNATIVFGCVLYPFVVLLVGPALANVPGGPWEAARLLGGRAAAFRHVTVPAMLPSVVGAFVVCFVLAITDFSVPDLLSFMLPAGGTPAYVFSTEIRLQWETQENTGRAVATGAPFLLLTAGLVVLAVLCLRRSPALAAGQEGRPRIALGPTQRVLAYLAIAAVLALSLGLPLAGVASWATTGETSASGTSADAKKVESSGSLFAFEQALDNTPKIREQRNRWMKTALAAAVLAMLVAVPLARAARRGGRGVRALVLALGALPLAVPGIVLSVGTILFWVPLDVGWVEGGITRSVLVLSARFLPFALLASWLAMRAVRPGYEESAATLGAGAGARWFWIWGPLSVRGVAVGGLLVLILALREFESVMLIDPRIYLARLYEKIHFSRLADEANLLILYLLYVLVPVALVAALVGLRRRR